MFMETDHLVYGKSVSIFQQQMVQMVQATLLVESGPSWVNPVQCHSQSTMTAAMSKKLLATLMLNLEQKLTGASVAVNASALIAVLKAGMPILTITNVGASVLIAVLKAGMAAKVVVL